MKRIPFFPNSCFLINFFLPSIYSANPIGAIQDRYIVLPLICFYVNIYFYYSGFQDCYKEKFRISLCMQNVDWPQAGGIHL